MKKYLNLSRKIDSKTYFKVASNKKSIVSRNYFLQVKVLLIMLIIINACKKESEFDLFLRQSPPTVTVTQVENGLKISWSSVHGADNYDVHRCDNNLCQFFQGLIIPINDTFLIEENPKIGYNFFRVSALKYKKSEDIYFSNNSEVVSFFYKSNNGEKEF